MASFQIQSFRIISAIAMKMRLRRPLLLLAIFASTMVLAHQQRRIVVDDIRDMQQNNDRHKMTKESPLLLHHLRRLRFALLNVPLQLKVVTTPMDLSALTSMETACQVFLEQELSVEEGGDGDGEPYSTTVSPQVRTSVLSQRLVEYLEQNTTTTTASPSSPSSYVLSTSIEVTIEYQLDSENDSDFEDMETRVLQLFANEWMFLRELLLVLDEAYFATVETIRLLPTSSSHNDEAFFEQFDTESAGRQPSNNKTNDDWSTHGLITVFTVAGVAVLISCLTLLPLLRIRCCSKSDGDDGETTAADDIDDRKPTFAGSSWSRAATRSGRSRSTSASSKDLGIISTEEEEEKSLEAGTRKGSNWHQSHDIPQTSVWRMGIQPIYSDDKMQHPTTLMQLHTKTKEIMKQPKTTTSKYRHSPEYGDLASIADSCPEVSSADERARDTLIPKTPPKMDQRKRDLEKQIEKLRNQKQVIEDRIRAKHEKLAVMDTTARTQRSREIADQQQSRQGEYLIEYVEDLLRRGDSMSTLTRVVDYDDNEEDEVEEAFGVAHDGSVEESARHTTSNTHGFPIVRRKEGSFLVASKGKEYH